jgi:hypothetical protein
MSISHAPDRLCRWVGVFFERRAVHQPTATINTTKHEKKTHEKTTLGIFSYESLSSGIPPKSRLASLRPAAIATGVSKA